MADVENPTQPLVKKQAADPSLQGLEPENVKNAFIRKVYALLTAELFYTAAVSAVFMFCAPLRNWSVSMLEEHSTLFSIVLMVSLIASICALFIHKANYPTNFYCLFAFVTLMSVNIGVVCAAYYATGQGFAIAQAVAITGVIFLTLTAYAHYTKTDFSFMIGFLMCALMANILLGLIAALTGSSTMTFIYDVLGVLVFCGFILYDTSALLHKYTVDDYLIASIELYLDVVNLFLHILSLLGNRK